MSHDLIVPTRTAETTVDSLNVSNGIRRLVADARERRLRSTTSQTCVVTRTYSTFGDRAFAAAGPGL